MSGFNKKHVTRKPTSPIKSKQSAVATHEGGIGLKRKPKSELFVTALSTLFEPTFYESEGERMKRITKLTEKLSHDIEWLTGLVTYLRQEVGLRTVSFVIAALTVKARLKNGEHGGNRQIINASIGRLDETSEMLAISRLLWGRNIPAPVKRGVGDALARLLTEKSVLKWGGKAGRGEFSLADVIRLTHPKLTGWKGDIARYVLNPNDDVPESLTLIRARNKFTAEAKGLSADGVFRMIRENPQMIDDAGLSIQAIESAAGAPLPGDLWGLMITRIGYTQLRMSLNKADKQSIDKSVVRVINDRLSDVEEVRRSRTLPIAFMSAYRNAPNAYAFALGEALDECVKNVPALKGRTLVLVDTSGSMGQRVSGKGASTFMDVASIFASAIYMRGESVDVVSFSDSWVTCDLGRKNQGILRIAEKIPFLGRGTSTVEAINHNWDESKYDRLIVISDEQYTRGHLNGVSFDRKPAFVWNVAGYKPGSYIPGDRVYTFAGLTDQSFNMMKLIEDGVDARWPWEQ